MRNHQPKVKRTIQRSGTSSFGEKDLVSKMVHCCDMTYLKTRDFSTKLRPGQYFFFEHCFTNSNNLHRNAPPEVLNVRRGQPVELRVARRVDEDFVPPPKRPLAAFGGSGQRLGSPVPTIAGIASQTQSQSQRIPGSFPESRPGSEGAGSSAGTPSQQPRGTHQHFEVDFNEPTTSVQVRLADGTR